MKVKNKTLERCKITTNIRITRITRLQQNCQGVLIFTFVNIKAKHNVRHHQFTYGCGNHVG